MNTTSGSANTTPPGAMISPPAAVRGEAGHARIRGRLSRSGTRHSCQLGAARLQLEAFGEHQENDSSA
jgi:hypothetical protein